MLLDAGNPIDLDTISLLPPIGCPSKIICIGPNYADHSAESGFSNQVTRRSSAASRRA